MSSVVVKSKYLTDRTHMVDYVNYIATREGVELLPNAIKSRAATVKQRAFIADHLERLKGLHEYAYYLACPTIENASQLITAYANSTVEATSEIRNISKGDSELVNVGRNSPDNPATQKQRDWIESHLEGATDLIEYEDFIKSPTFGNASDLISAIAELNVATDPEIYLKYIAERPGVYLNDGEAHGLWNMNGKANLQAELEKIKTMDGVAWTHIVSLRRENAQKLGYENSAAWRKIVAANADRIAKLYNIDIKNLVLLGAFHNEGHHPHVHLFMYSSAGGNEGVIPKQAMKKAGERMRSMFTNSIFKEEITPMISKREELRKDISRRVLAVSEAYKKDYAPDPDILAALTDVSRQLPRTGKLQYAFMPPPVKQAANEALRRIVGNDAILSGVVSDYFQLQHAMIEKYYTDPEKTEAKFIEFVEHFYEPQTGKYVKNAGSTELHNIILRSAAMLRQNPKLILHVTDGHPVQLQADAKGVHKVKMEKPEPPPVLKSADGTNRKPEPVPVDNSTAKNSEDPEIRTDAGDVVRIYDMDGNLVYEKPTDPDGRATVDSLPAGTYSAENSGSGYVTPSEYMVKYAAVIAVRSLTEMLVGLCDTVETATKPEKPKQARQQQHYRGWNNRKKREEIAR